ncbi:CHRD domain-containing protein [Hymenobacter sp. RP-2-7]|uniref:CHRD domain-containing protein n=1 Tax=Hymenobacter polaris TaxID=2682546 RepID=A0A7Y0FMK7_9BACT|nr:CHRD domain-containing protein [Hymenobacter polaris]NML65519.1 CHRD domain-containing protein [Hymenobacter polaris]
MKIFLFPALALLVAASACKKNDDTPAPATMQVTGNLSAANSVPAVSVASSGIGQLTGTYDSSTHLLTYNVNFSGLTGPATMAHIHYGDTRHAGGVAIALTVPAATSGTISGKIPLVMTTASGSSPAASQPDSLLTGKLYVNIHTDKNPAGEIRANLLAK